MLASAPRTGEYGLRPPRLSGLCRFPAPLPAVQLPRGRTGAGQTLQPRGQVKLLHRAGALERVARPTAGRGAFPRLTPQPECIVFAGRRGSAWRPSSFAPPPGPAALRPRSCPVRGTRLQVAPGPPPHARRPELPRVRDLHNPPSFSRPLPHLAQRRVLSSPGSGPLNPRLRPPGSSTSQGHPRPLPTLPGCGPAWLPASVARLGSLSAGKESGTGEDHTALSGGGRRSRELPCPQGSSPGDFARRWGPGRLALSRLLCDGDLASSKSFPVPL